MKLTLKHLYIPMFLILMAPLSACGLMGTTFEQIEEDTVKTKKIKIKGQDATVKVNPRIKAYSVDKNGAGTRYISANVTVLINGKQVNVQTSEYVKQGTLTAENLQKMIDQEIADFEEIVATAEAEFDKRVQAALDDYVERIDASGDNGPISELLLEDIGNDLTEQFALDFVIDYLNDEVSDLALDIECSECL